MEDVKSSPQRLTLVHANPILEAAGNDLLNEFMILGGKGKTIPYLSPHLTLGLWYRWWLRQGRLVEKCVCFPK